MRNQLLTGISVTALVVAGLAPAASADSDDSEPVMVEFIPLPFDPTIVTPTIPEEPPPGDDDGVPIPLPINPELEFCFDFEDLCRPDIDDLLNPGGDDDPGDDDDEPGDGDDEPGDGDDEPGDGDDEPGDGDDEPGDGDDDPGDGDDEPGDGDDEPGDGHDEPGDGDDEPGDGGSGIDEPRPGTPTFTG